MPCSYRHLCQLEAVATLAWTCRLVSYTYPFIGSGGDVGARKILADIIGQHPRLTLLLTAVFGEHLRKVSIYASISVVLGGREHELPVVVVTAVEELYRKGIYQQPIPYSPQPCSSLPTHQHLRLTASARKRHSTPPNTIRGTTQSPGRFRSRYFTPSRVDPRYLRPPLHVPSIPSRTYPPSHPIPCPLGLVRGSGRNQRSRGTPSFL